MGKSSKKGFTIIEIVISLAILSIISVPITTMALTTVRIQKKTDETFKANIVASQILEYTKQSQKSLENIDFKNDLKLYPINSKNVKRKFKDDGENEEDFYLFKEDKENDYIIKIKEKELEENQKLSYNDNTSGLWEITDFDEIIKVENSDEQIIIKNDDKKISIYKNTVMSGNITDKNERPVLNIELIKGHDNNSLKINFEIIYKNKMILNGSKSKSISGSDINEDMNLNIELCGDIPKFIINANNNANVLGTHKCKLKIFINKVLEIKDKNEYLPEYSMFSNDDVRIYSRLSMDNKLLMNAKKMFNVSVEVYKCKLDNYNNIIGDKELLQKINGSRDIKYK